MLRLSKSLSAWGTPAFEEILKEEIERLDVGVLPLQQGLSRGGYSDGEGLSVMIIGISDEPTLIRAKTGVFYTAIIAGQAYQSNFFHTKQIMFEINNYSKYFGL